MFVQKTCLIKSADIVKALENKEKKRDKNYFLETAKRERNQNPRQPADTRRQLAKRKLCGQPRRSENDFYPLTLFISIVIQEIFSVNQQKPLIY